MFRKRKTTALLNWVPSQLFPKHSSPKKTPIGVYYDTH